MSSPLLIADRVVGANPVIDAFFITGPDGPSATYLTISVWDFNQPRNSPIVAVVGPMPRRRAEKLKAKILSANSPERIIEHGIAVPDGGEDIGAEIRAVAEAEALRMQGAGGYMSQ